MEIPSSFYYVAGVMVVSNLAVILTGLGMIFKAGMFVAETRSGIKDAKDSAIRAHKRLDSTKSGG